MRTVLTMLAVMMMTITGHCPVYNVITVNGPYETETTAYEVVVDSMFEEGYEDIAVIRTGEYEYTCKGHKTEQYCDITYYVVFECYGDKVNIVKEREVRHCDGHESRTFERDWYGGHPADAWVLIN